MKHVLDSIVETCQKVTTQSHSDTALMKRVPGHVIVARQEIAPAVFAVLTIIAAIVLSIVWVEGDDKVRGNDVECLVEHFN